MWNISTSKFIQILTKHFSPPSYNQITNIIGYGSGVVKQSRSQNAKTQIDLIITVKNSPHFHNLNYQHNINDYTGLVRIFGIKYLQFLQKRIFPWHSNHITINGLSIKYTIVQQTILLKDLQLWNYLSMAGRLSKPIINMMQSQSLNLPLTINLHSSIYVTILLFYKKHDKYIKLEQFFCKLCEISYMGDIRDTFKIEEIKVKANKIVQGNLIGFQTLYLPIITKLKKQLPQNIVEISIEKGVLIKYDARLIAFLVQRLPKAIKKQMQNELDFKDQTFNRRALADKILLQGLGDGMKLLEKIIKKKNRRSSFWMAMQNFFGSSLIQNIKYLLLKITKNKNNK